jgi:hypothetical protein
MKPRHAAALALVGWYLMTPPPELDQASGKFNFGSVDLMMPLSGWTIEDSFDSVQECKKEQAAMIADDRRVKALRLRADMAALCIGTDDPRLAK